MKKALLYDPYLDTLGGGERYFLFTALTLKSQGYDVEIAWADQSILNKAFDRFGIPGTKDLKINTNITDSLRGTLIRRYLTTRIYDLIFWVSDGSLPILFSRNNLIHYQVPFTKINGNSYLNAFKSISVDKFVFNSNFTRNIFEKTISVSQNKGFVLYPPVDTAGFAPAKKEKLILSVARFGSPSHAKRQDILLEAMRQLVQKDKEYKLILAGATMAESDYLTKLAATAQKISKTRIEIKTNPTFKELKELYGKATFFWHAAGFGVDENKSPESVEHFGITTVEAMASGAIPVVIGKGGQREIITPGTGYLCDSIGELVSNTLDLISSKTMIEKYSKAARLRSADFSQDKFISSFSKILK